MSSKRPALTREHAAARRVLPLLCAIIATTTVGVPGAQAAARSAVFALQPVGSSAHAGYFVLDARPGTRLRRAVRVANTGTADGIALLYPVDATTGQTTGAVYLSRRAPRRDVGAWVHLPAGRLSLAPNESRTLSLTITVPRNAASGQHLGGVVVETARVTRGATRRSGRGSFRIDVRSLTIVAVQLNLPGARREQIALTGARAAGVGGHQALLINMRNDGNQLTRGLGELTISDGSGRPLRVTRFPLDTFVPHTQIADPVAIPGRGLPDGSYRADVTLRYGHGHLARLRAGFTISRRQLQQVFGSSAQQAPPATRAGSAGPSALMLVLGGLALVVVAFLAALLVLRRRIRSGPASQGPTPP